ncbi:MAG: hypothetical protein K8T20_08140 [Planctomycetes bacterium]|nr:hypothetical protein [Planctomycetota bacterium]
MTCQELANDQMLAPTAEASSHLAGCEDCRERQKAVTLAARALRAMAGESAFPESNDRAIRAAIPQLAADAARRRPAGWWQVAAAAAVLLVAVGGGLKWAERKASPPAERAMAKAENVPAGEVAVPVKPSPDTSKPVDHEVPRPLPPGDPIPKPPDPPPADPVIPKPPGGTGFVARGPEPPPDVTPKPVPLPPPTGKVPRDSAGVVDCMQIVKGLLGSGEPVSCDLNEDGQTGVADAMLAARLAAAERRAR